MSRAFSDVDTVCAVCIPTVQHVYLIFVQTIHPSIHPAASSLLAIFHLLLRISKTFQAFSSPCSSSRQIEEGFLNDPLIIGSGVTLGFFFSQRRLHAFLPHRPSPPLYLSLVFKGLSSFFFPPLSSPLFTCTPLPLLPPEWLFGLFVCAHEVECHKVPESTPTTPFFFFLKINLKSH